MQTQNATLDVHRVLQAVYLDTASGVQWHLVERTFGSHKRMRMQRS